MVSCAPRVEEFIHNFMFESSGLTKCLSTAGLLRARASCSRELDVQRRAPPELQERGQVFLPLRQLRRGLDIVRRLAPWPDSLQAHARAADDGLPHICVLRRYPVKRSEPRSG